MKRIYSCVIVGVLALASCQKKELPVKPHDSGNVTTATVDLGSPYRYQVYFNLRTNTVVGQNLKTAWDIGCETSAEGYRIVLNASKSMFAFNTNKTDFVTVSIADTVGYGLNRKWDAPSGNMDSTAVGDWRNETPVYIIDRGYDENGKVLGKEKMQLLAVTPDTYTIRFATLNGTGDTTIQVSKDSTYNLAFVSFDTKSQTTIEPPRATWDLVFTQYTYIFYDYTPPLPYLVTGCILNRYKTQAVKDTIDQFTQISDENVSHHPLSNDISIVGYDWKTFNGTSYTVNTGYNYIIHTSEGRYYKMHFIGYYNSSGAEGNPKWEYQEL